MAKKTETLTIKVDADTRAAEHKLTALDKDLDDLGGGSKKKTIKVDADTASAQRDISDLLEDVDKLSSEDAIVRLKLEQQNLGAQLRDILSDVEKLDASDPTIDAKMEQGDKIIGDLDQIESKLKEINDTDVHPDTSRLESGLTSSKAKTDELSDSTRGARSALANMIGNSAQDLGNLGGIAQSAGVAIGQMAEYASDATLAGEGLGSALTSMATVAGPIVAITAGVQLLSKAMEAANKEAKIQAELAHNAADAWAEFLGITDGLDTTLQGVGESAAFADDQFVSLGVSLFQGISKGENATQDLKEINEALLNLGVVTADTAAPDFFRTLGGELALLGQSQAAIANLQDLASASELVSTSVSGPLPQPELWNQYAEAVSGVAAAFAQSAPAAAQYASEVAVAIAQGDDETEIVNALADALVASGKVSVEAAQTTAQGIFDANEQIITSFENLDDTVDQSALNTFATDALDKASSSSLELASAILEIRRANPTASDFQVWLLLQQYIKDSGFAMREFADQVSQLTFDPMLSDQFADLVGDVKDGTIDIANFDEVVQGLAKAWGISEDAVRQYILQEADKQLSDEASAAEEATQAQEDYAKAISDAQTELAKLGNIDLSGVADGLQAALDVSDDFIDHLKFGEDFQHQLDDALDSAKKFGPDLQELLDLQAQGIEITPDITLGNLESDDAEFLAWVQGLRDMVQEGAVEAFQHGGTESANAFVQAQAQAIADATGLDIGQVYRLMGLPPDGNIDVLVNPVIATEKLNAIQPIIDQLVSSGVLSPEIALQISALTIDDPEAALALAIQVLEGAGIEVPASLKVDTAEADTTLQTYTVSGITVPVATAPDETVAQTAQQLDEFGNPINVTVFAPKSDSLGAMDKLIDFVARKRDVALKVTADNAGAIDRILDVVADERTADIKANATNVGPTDTTLDGLAMPSEDGRIAYIFAQPSNTGPADAALDAVAHQRYSDIHVSADNAGSINNILDHVARNRTSHITVVTTNTGGGGGGGGGGNSVNGQAAPLTAQAMTLSAEPMALDTPVSQAAVASSVSFSTTPTVVNNHYHNNVSVSAAVIGNRYEVDRAVTRALRRNNRLNGSRVAS